MTVVNMGDPQTTPAARRYKFDIFKGEMGGDGIVRRVRSVGAAFLTDGMRTYTVHLKTLLIDTFYLLPEQEHYQEADFSILTRELSTLPGRKYFWHHIGRGVILPPPNHGVVRLAFDLFGAADLYLSLYPVPTRLDGCAASDDGEVA